jgi:hypothetical protein
LRSISSRLSARLVTAGKSIAATAMAGATARRRLAFFDLQIIPLPLVGLVDG